MQVLISHSWLTPQCLKKVPVVSSSLADSCDVDGALPPFRLDIDIDSPDRRERVSSYRTTPGGSEHVRLKYVEDIATEVFRRQTEEDLARVLELLNCLRNQQCSSTHLNYQHKQPSDDFEEVLQDLRKSPTNTSRDNAQASLISYIGIGGNLVRVIDNIKASLRSWFVNPL